jgi:hypothetical protein
MAFNEKLNESTQMGGESFRCLEKKWTENVKYNTAQKINEGAVKLRERERERERGRGRKAARQRSRQRKFFVLLKKVNYLFSFFFYAPF